MDKRRSSLESKIEARLSRRPLCEDVMQAANGRVQQENLCPQFTRACSIEQYQKHEKRCAKKGAKLPKAVSAQMG